MSTIASIWTLNVFSSYTLPDKPGCIIPSFSTVDHDIKTTSLNVGCVRVMSYQGCRLAETRCVGQSLDIGSELLAGSLASPLSIHLHLHNFKWKEVSPSSRGSQPHVTPERTEVLAVPLIPGTTGYLPKAYSILSS